MVVQTFVAALIGALSGTFGAELVKAKVRKDQNIEATRDALVVELQQAIDGLRKCAIEFWSKNAEDLGADLIPLQSRLIGEQQYVSSCISNLFNGKQADVCNVAASKFFYAISSGDFDDPKRKLSKPVLTQIHVTSLSLRLHTIKSRNEMKRPFFA